MRLYKRGDRVYVLNGEAPVTKDQEHISHVVYVKRNKDEVDTWWNPEVVKIN